MKKFLLSIAILFSSVFVNAQGLGYLDLPVVGELWIEFKDTVGSNFAITPSGTGQNWDYSNSFTVHDTIEFLPQAPTSAPSNISSLFPTATLVDEAEVPGDYTFIKTDTTGMYIDGMHSANGFDVAGFTLTDINYTVDLLYIPVPFQYGDLVQNTASYEYIFPDSNLLPGALVRATYSTFQDIETESQGQLTTPLGNYASTIRIREMLTKSILYEIDSFADGNYTFLTDFSFPTTTAYKWLKNGPNCLVMTAELDEFGSVVAASYYTSSGLVADKNGIKNTNIMVSPNPVNQGDNITIRLNDLSATSLIVYDLSGRELYQTNVNKRISNISLNTAQFETGIYYAKLYDNKKSVGVVKLVVTQ